MRECVDCVVIGAGVVGLATARALALAGREVLVLEATSSFGSGISSRNSEVIHAGMYYPTHSLRARLCVSGNALLRRYAQDHQVDFKMVGKLIVATTEAEEAALAGIFAKGQANGVTGLVSVSAAHAKALEPELTVVKALWSPDTGIIDSHGLMVALLADLEQANGQLVLNAPILQGKALDDAIELEVGGAEPMVLAAKSVVLAAGLSAPRLGRALGLNNVPQDYLCKGNYFALTGKMPFSHLVYPVPQRDGLGVHYTMDLQGRGRFGPDVEWTEEEDYQVDPKRATPFLDAIKHYWPGIEGRELTPAYAGIRPKIYGPHEKGADFMIHGADQHGVLGLVALYGIESPGLTSSLALAQLVTEMLT